MNETDIYCVHHKRNHTNEEQSAINWRHQKWQVDGEVVDGWGCIPWATAITHEFIPETIKEGRKKYAKQLLQPFRAGQVSKEYLDAYPKQREGMIKEGVITRQQADKAKNVWAKDIY